MKCLKYCSLVTFLLFSVSLGFANNKKTSVIDINGEDLLRIEKIGNARSVIIDNVIRFKGDVFKAKHKVLLSDKEYLKVTNKRTGAILTVSGRDFSETKTQSFEAYYKVFLGGKGAVSDFRKVLQRYPHNMVNDTIRIYTMLQLDNDHGFTIKPYHEGKRLSPSVAYDNETNELVLTKDYFLNNGIKLEEGKDYKFIVEYWERDKAQFMTDCFIIRYIKDME